MLQKAPSMNPDGVDALVTAWQRDHDHTARDRLVRRYIPLIQKVSGDMAFRWNFDRDDAFQAGALGFMRALDLYDATRIPLVHYAANRMKADILRALNGQTAAVPLGLGMINDLGIVRRATRDLERRGERVTPEALQRVTGKSAYRIGNALWGMAIQCQSTETPIRRDDGDLTLGDALEAPEGMRPDVIAEANMVTAKARAAINTAALNVLKPRDREIARLRLVDGLTLQDVGKRYGVGRERIRQIEVRILRKMRAALEGDQHVRELLDA